MADSDSKKEKKAGSISKKIKRFFLIIISALILAVLIKAFILDAYRIPTGSMENTLVPGDFIIVNKAAYDISLPFTIPFTSIGLPHSELIKFKDPERYDVVVFKFPYFGKIQNMQPVNYVKRIIGMPGDTVKIKDKKVYINSNEIKSPPGAIIDYDKIGKGPEENIFPKNRYWSRNNYGPYVVPYKGMVVSVNAANIDDWEILIDRDNNKKAVSIEGTVITVNKIPVRKYTFKKNYYFVMGDNRDNSYDSRYWGVLPDDALLGKAMMIYWSQMPGYKFDDITGWLNSIRGKRLLKFIR